MTRIQLTDSTVAQARELVRAIQALDTIECPDPFERAVAELFQAAYKRRLMEMVEVVPSWMADEIRSAAGPAHAQRGDDVQADGPGDHRLDAPSRQRSPSVHGPGR